MPPSEPADTGPYRLNAHAPDENTRIEVLDGNLRAIKLEKNLGNVSLGLPAGVYSVRFHQGGNYTEKLAALMPETPVVDVAITESEEPNFATAAPVPNTTTTHEWQSEPARDLSRSTPLPAPPGHTGGSSAFLFLRNPFQGGALPFGLTLHELEGEKVLDLDAQGIRNNKQQWLGAHLKLNPGAYRLRMPCRSSFAEQVIFTAAGWQTQVFLMTLEGPERQQNIGRISILMARPAAGFDFQRPDFRLTEAALRALASRGNIPGPARSEILWAKFENPMLGIYAGLCHLRRMRADPLVLREVFKNLCALVGPLPDVLAIGWGLVRRDEKTRADVAFMSALRQSACASPPMLRESWEHLLRASALEPELIPHGSVADRIGGRLVSGTPWITWLGDLPARGVAPTPAQAFEIPASQARSLAGKTKPLADIFHNLFGKFFEDAKSATLRAGLPSLTQFLGRAPEARFWLQTKRFTDLERRIAYWLQPALDPRFTAAIEADPELARKIHDQGTNRTVDEATLLTELDISSTTALRASWEIFNKLFARPVLPGAGRLKTFVDEESRARRVYARILKGIERKSTRIFQPLSKRNLNLLEFVYLYYRGSPADGIKQAAVLERLAQRLDESGFVFAERSTLAAADLSAQHSEAQREVIELLERASIPRGWRLPEAWQVQVLPTLDRYTMGALLPALEKKPLKAPTQTAPPSTQGGLATAD